MDCQVLLILVLNAIGFCCSEIIVNGNFETELDGTNWVCNSCTLERDEDAFWGVFGGKITNRYKYFRLVSISYFIFLNKQSSYGFLHKIQQEIYVNTLMHEVYLIHVVCNIYMNCFIFAGQRIGPGLPSTSLQWQEAVINFQPNWNYWIRILINYGIK